MENTTYAWGSIGSLPTSDELVEKIDSVPHVNDEDPASEVLWNENGKKYEAGYASSEMEFFNTFKSR